MSEQGTGWAQRGCHPLRHLDELRFDAQVALPEAVERFTRAEAEVAQLREGGKQLDGVIVRLSDENERLRRERDLALAHDTQPYPTADAYEKACAALQVYKRENERLREASVRTLGYMATDRQRMRLAEAEAKRLLALGDELAASVQERWTGPTVCDCRCCSAAKAWHEATSS